MVIQSRDTHSKMKYRPWDGVSSLGLQHPHLLVLKKARVRVHGQTADREEEDLTNASLGVSGIVAVSLGLWRTVGNDE